MKGLVNKNFFCITCVYKIFFRNVLATMQSYPDNFKNCLVFSEEKLTAVLVEDLFKPGLSPGGSNRRVTEERIIGYWMDFLQDAEGRATS